MRHQRNQALVARQDGGSGEGEARVLHAAEGKAGREHQQIVAAPAVRTVHLLHRRDHGFRVGELAGGGVHQGRLGIDAGARAERAETQIAGGQRDQVRRNRLVHLEMAIAHFGAHHGAQAVGRADPRRCRSRAPRACPAAGSNSARGWPAIACKGTDAACRRSGADRATAVRKRPERVE